MGDGRERKGRDLDEVVVWCVGPYAQQEQNRLEVVTPRVVGPPLTGLITGQGEDPPTLTPGSLSLFPLNLKTGMQHSPGLSSWLISCSPWMYLEHSMFLKHVPLLYLGLPPASLWSHLAPGLVLGKLTNFAWDIKRLC